MRSVDEMGPKWRKIAALLPNRSDDAVRNRWHRLSEAQRHREDLGLGASIGPDGQPSSLPQGNIGDRSSVYRCSRCGQPKKAHVCTAPEAMSSAEQVRAACAFFLPHPPLATCSSPFVSPLSLSLFAPLSTHSLTQAKLRKDMQSSDPAQQNGDLRSAWTKTEDEIILSSVNEFGPKWVEIAGRLPGRTEHAARNRYHRLVSRGAANDAP